MHMEGNRIGIAEGRFDPCHCTPSPPGPIDDLIDSTGHFPLRKKHCVDDGVVVEQIMWSRSAIVSIHGGAQNGGC
jgi:hypothetical protein